MYKLEVRPGLDKKFKKLSKKNKKQLQIINKKVLQILENPRRFKLLRYDMKNKRRVHIDNHFVLVYTVDDSRKTVILEEYDHYEKAYE